MAHLYLHLYLYNIQHRLNSKLISQVISCLPFCRQCSTHPSHHTHFCPFQPTLMFCIRYPYYTPIRLCSAVMIYSWVPRFLSDVLSDQLIRGYVVLVWIVIVSWFTAQLCWIIYDSKPRIMMIVNSTSSRHSALYCTFDLWYAAVHVDGVWLYLCRILHSTGVLVWAYSLFVLYCSWGLQLRPVLV